MDEHRNLVEMARRHLELELSSIRPELTPSLKADESNLGEEEFNISMAHAYWKIISLQKEPARQQVCSSYFFKYAMGHLNHSNYRRKDIVQVIVP